MCRHMKSLFIFGFLLISTLLFSQDFEVAPVLMSFDANPGEIQIQKLTLRNHANIRQKFVFNLADYEIDLEGNKEPKPVGTTHNSCADWISINPSFIELNPNEEAQVDVNMAVPPDGFKTKWCMIQVQVAKEQESFEADRELTTGVVLVPRIVVLVKQSPKSNTNYRGKITRFTEITKPGDVNRIFQVVVENTGDKIFDAKVNLTIANIMTAEEQSFNPTEITVYPGNARQVELTLPIKPQPGKYALAALLDYGHRRPIEGSQLLLEVK
jgi:hypothetical protein